MAGKTEGKAFDVIVVGAGPAGSTCAWLLGKMGCSVLLLEKQAQMKEKVCAGALVPNAVGLLQELGLQLGKEMPCHVGDRLIVTSDAGAFQGKPREKVLRGRHCLLVRRKHLDTALFKRAAACATVKKGLEVRSLIFGAGKVVGVRAAKAGAREEVFFASVVVGADGANSVVARETGNLRFKPEHQVATVRAYFKGLNVQAGSHEVYFLDKTFPGYFWIVPLPGGIANVGIGMLQSAPVLKKTGLREHFHMLVGEHPLLRERFKKAKAVSRLEGAPIPMGSLKNKCYGNGFVLVGDAARLVDPISGGGIASAIDSARIASGVLCKALQGNDFSETALAEYGDKVAEKRKQFYYAYLIQRLYSMKQLRHFFTRRAAKKGELGTTFAEIFFGLLDKKAFLSPVFLAKLLT